MYQCVHQWSMDSFRMMLYGISRTAAILSVQLEQLGSYRELKQKQINGLIYAKKK